MNKIYIKHIYQVYLIRFIYISLIFSSLIFVLNILEELKFFNDNEGVGIGLPVLLTFLNLPSILFEIFPFIILITTQFFFIKFQNNAEILIFRNNGINNFKIISYLALLVFIIGIFIISVFHFLSTNMKQFYLEFKNEYVEDKKYLAVVNENGLWIKDRFQDQIFIIHAEEIDRNILKNLVVTEYNEEFINQANIIAKKANIRDKTWILEDVIIIQSDGKKDKLSSLSIDTNFDYIKINSLFSNLESLDVLKLYRQKKDFENVGLSVLDIEIQINKIMSMPVSLIIFFVISSILMFNVNFNKSKTLMLIIGILMSVIMYYVYYFFGLLGSNNKIPTLIAIWMPNLILFLVCIIGIVNINEK